jgi:hypothetical protein|mmetsp:Transcript_86301/g.143561  ORF Transcript_86301/g.143561 Transcript_86301/m.143561 type:complete len:86 (+) Transcript_86301:744-1001(+)
MISCDSLVKKYTKEIGTLRSKLLHTWHHFQPVASMHTKQASVRMRINACMHTAVYELPGALQYQRSLLEASQQVIDCPDTSHLPA